MPACERLLPGWAFFVCHRCGILYQVRKKYLQVLGGILLVLVLAGGMTFFVRDRAAKEQANEAAHTLFGDPDATPYIDSSGQSVSLESYLGTILIVNSWASWSPFSVQELQDLNQIAGDFKDKNVAVIAINRKENNDQAQRFLSTLPGLPHLKIVVDTADYFYGAIGGYAMPETVMYNKAGTIKFHRQGALTKEELQTEVQRIIDSGE